MATPFVAGVVALGLEAAPASTPAAVKAALQASAKDAGATGADNEWGHGLVDARAFIAGLGAEPAGTAAWPAHQVLTGSLAANASRDTRSRPTAGRPLGVTLQITTAPRRACCRSAPPASTGTSGHRTSTRTSSTRLAASWQSVAACSRPRTGTARRPDASRPSASRTPQPARGRCAWSRSPGPGATRRRLRRALRVEPPPPPPPPAVPSAPTGLTAVTASSTQVRLAWTDTSSNENGFRVERCTGGSCTAFAVVASLPAGSSGLHEYRVEGQHELPLPRRGVERRRGVGLLQHRHGQDSTQVARRATAPCPACRVAGSRRPAGHYRGAWRPRPTLVSRRLILAPSHVPTSLLAWYEGVVAANRRPTGSSRRKASSLGCLPALAE